MKPLLRTLVAALILCGLVRVAAQHSPGPIPHSSLVFDAPKEGETFRTPGLVPMEITAVDPRGEIREVDFYAGDHLLGTSRILTKEAVIPGRPRFHFLTWTNPPPGWHVLFAQAVDASGEKALSQPRHIRVGDPTSVDVPRVTVTTTERFAVEGDLMNSGLFEMRRSGGDLSKPLAVQFELTGEARRGVDYRLLLNPCWTCNRAEEEIRGDTVTIPEGQAGVILGVEAAFDGLLPVVEAPLESVVLRVLTPPVIAVLGAKPPYEAGQPDTAEVWVVDRADPTVAAAIIISPHDAADFQVGAEIPIEAIAIDPAGSIRRLEFLANDKLIGVSEILTKDVDFPGRPRIHHTLWKDAPIGGFKLRAQAKSASGEGVVSAVVVIHVRGGIERPTITIAPGKTPAFERGDFKSRFGSFQVTRKGGDLFQPVRVYYLLGGTATLGLDYDLLAPDGKPAVSSPSGAAVTLQSVVIPGGQTSTVIALQARPDDLVEGTETVVVTLVEPPFAAGLSPLPSPYNLGEPHEAKIQIIDGNPAVARVVIDTPANGDTFKAPGPVPITATAVHPKLGIVGLRFFANGTEIGKALYCCPTCLCAAPIPGQPFTGSMDWAGMKPGGYTLVVKADTLANVVVESAPVKVMVQPTDPLPTRISAVRVLPAGLAPGTKFTVSILVKPGQGVQNFTVEDHPPYTRVGGAPPPPKLPQWVVTSISDDGVFDPGSGSVKFGPFFDRRPRKLTYEITPNAASIDVAKFTGNVVADGFAAMIGGDHLLLGKPRHPADRDPADDSINAVELTAYGAAWKSGREWSGGPNPIPMDYVTRAGALWRGGEHYRFEPKAGPAPLWWVADPLLPPAGGRPAGVGVSNPIFHAIALRSVHIGADARREITLRIMAAPRVAAIALEERVTGTPSAISDEGLFDPNTRTIRWGPFLGNVPHTLTYELSGSDQLEQGTVSSDGRGADVRTVPQTRTVKGPRLLDVSDTRDGAVQVVLEDDALRADAGYDLEVSTNLREWSRVGGFVMEGTTGFSRDETPMETEPRFYRALRTNPTPAWSGGVPP